MSGENLPALPSPLEPVVDRYRRWTPIWYPYIKRLLDGIRSVKDSVFSINETIDEINGKWSLELNENGRVIGAITLAADQNISSFSVLANKFIVVHPTANGTTMQAFVVGLVNGVSTVGINGNLIVDGTIGARQIIADSITADKLDVSTLSAISANVGTVTAGVLKSADNKFIIDLNNKTLTITT